MMELLAIMTDWLVSSRFYTEFCVNLPQPLNNPYFDVMVLIIILIMLILGIRDAVQSFIFHQKLKKKAKTREKECREHGGYGEDVDEGEDEEDGLKDPDYITEEISHITRVSEEVSDSCDTLEEMPESDMEDYQDDIPIPQKDYGELLDGMESSQERLDHEKKEGDLSEFEILMMNLKAQKEAKARTKEEISREAKIKEYNLRTLDKRLQSETDEKSAEEKEIDASKSLMANIEARREEYRKEEDRRQKRGLFSRRFKQ